MSRVSRPGRRDLLRAGALSVLGLAGCDRVLSGLASLSGESIPEHIEPPNQIEIDPIHHLLNRAGFGAWPGEVEEVRRIGKEAHIDAQLAPESIDDHACGIRTDVIDTVNLPTSLLFDFPPDEVELELRRYSFLRAVYSKRQLFEVMVETWSDHFNIAIGKSLCRHLKTSDDQEVIRKHALGRFRDLLGASALSPAMLVYLDGRDNKRENSGDKPNENYARELMELHTLGVHGGYTQQDVMEAARCLTGFVVREEWAPGLVEFVPHRHDDGEKIVLGQTIAAGGGRQDIERLLDIVADHPSTARFISEKLSSVLVADDPPASVVRRATEVFTESKGDIQKVVRAILMSDELEAAKGSKVKRPFRLMVSALRAVGADTHAKGDLLEHLGRMGQPLFSYPTPDGYPTRSDAWFGTVLWRWSFALALAEDRLEGTRVDWKALRAAFGPTDSLPKLARHFYGRVASDAELLPITNYDGENVDAKRVALLLSAPAFQRY
jgi:Protein of unknown function (DUF1800)